ncbi:hypothetical protein [Hirschia baltica]|uniref:Uncharacterized protein n=1 Tax=Hirschia baltica (strain ATCC 49814 / DSM 5838 / IFAM 1418) TaxID=582402 RepID=C6XN04_HIRBI|nr:hypothetical protein [Hirschia baltica]ACT58174.1 hypothetical protein Hbal_0472 [Hirschia baltica ATCC 49814]
MAQTQNNSIRCLPFETQENLLNWLKTQDLILQRWRDEVLTSPEADVRFVERLEAHRSWLQWEMKQLIPV